MDGREGMALAGASAPYYIHRGGVVSSAAQVGRATLHTPTGFKSLSNAQVQAQQNVGSTFSMEPQSSIHSQGINSGVSSGVPSGEPVKKKRGRPRKYAPDGQVSLGLLPMRSNLKPSSRLDNSGHKRPKGRPPGTGRKQRLAALGEWMNSSAGMAFAPHVITIGIGQDIVAKMLSFSQQRPRAVCILSGTGMISSVTLRQPASSTPTVTYEGRFEILCLSGSYLVAEDGGPRSRTGGISASLSTPDGQVIGGGIATLIAASPVQLVVCSFIYGESKMNTQLASPHGAKDSSSQLSNKSAAMITAPLSQNFTPGMSVWPVTRPIDLRNPHTDIDLTRG